MTVQVGVTVNVAVGSRVTVRVAVGVTVKVTVEVNVTVAVEVTVGVWVAVEVTVGVAEFVEVAVYVPVAVGVTVYVAVSVGVFVIVSVSLGLKVRVIVLVGVIESVTVGVPVALAVKVTVAVGAVHEAIEAETDTNETLSRCGPPSSVTDMNTISFLPSVRFTVTSAVDQAVHAPVGTKTRSGCCKPLITVCMSLLFTLPLANLTVSVTVCAPVELM